ncbi:MAG: ATP-dependent DNA ligase [Verrucomicrobium sp.]|nr:ATP-dependent DNA ligase [Verrucomicrobium sp.]
MSWQVVHERGIRLPQVDLWLDPPFPVDRAFVSHAHFDHMARHRRVILTEGTSRLMAARMPAEREEIVLPYDTPYALDAETELRLYPAGHIHGSAQLWLRREGESLLYTGDFKLREGRSAEKCAVPQADVAILETTFGLPHYVFPPTEEVLKRIAGFCRAALEEGEVPVLLGYSLGKSQELLASLAEARLPLMLHPQTERMTKIYEAMGIVFPPYRSFDLPECAGRVVICPPQANGSAWLKRIRPRRVAAVTGWAMDPNAVYRYQCDAAFPLSDHADFPQLLEFIERVGPRRVYTVHGYAHEFAQTLRAQGIEAWALEGDNQTELFLAAPEPAVPVAFPLVPEAEAAPGTFAALAATAEAVGKVSGKLEKRDLLADYLGQLDADGLAAAAVFFTGRPFPSSAHLTLNLGSSLIRRAVLAIAGTHEGEFRALYRRFSDTGDTVEALLQGKTRPAPLPLPELEGWFRELAATSGPAQKVERLETMLRRLSAREGKYLSKIVTGDLRIGLKEGLVEEALARATGRPLEAVREANLLAGDLSAVARAALGDALASLQPSLFHPLQLMLASPEPDAAAVVERLGAPVWLEEKYDGIRCQIHKGAGAKGVELYSRELRRTTGQFPEIVRAAAGLPGELIADGEILAWEKGRALPFASLQKRLGRQGDDFFLGQEIPVTLLLYDLLWQDGESLLKLPLRERRARLEKLALPPGVGLAPRSLAADAVEVEAAFLRARERGNEGLMAKDPESPYTPGRRGLSWIKLKKAYATLDVVVVAVELGHGKRRDVLSDYTFAVRDEETGALLPVGKAYSGLTDAEIARLTEFFLEHTLETRGRRRIVDPQVVIEVAFNGIQSSDRHASGYALRFPRIARLRPDKSPAEIDTLQTCRRLAAGMEAAAPA